jgi:hypothetical protein
VYRLKEHVRVKREDVADKDLARVRDGLLAQKRRDAVNDYVRELLKKADADKAVFVDEDALEKSAAGSENT